MVVICFGKNYFLAMPLGSTRNFYPTTGHLTALKVVMWQMPKKGVEN